MCYYLAMTPVLVEQLKQKLQQSSIPWLRKDEPSLVATAPGHIDVLGGLAVEAGGTVAQMTVPRRAVVAVQLRAEAVLEIHRDSACSDEPAACATIPLERYFHEGRLIAARDVFATLTAGEQWTAPVLAAWYIMTQAGRLTGSTGQTQPKPAGMRGLAVVFSSQLPPGAGLGSSTAIIAAVLNAFNQLIGGFIDGDELALYIGRTESLLPEGFGHVIDALTVIHAIDKTGPKILRLSAQPHSLAGQITLPRDLRIMALDTGVRYPARAESLQILRAAGAMGLRIVETIYKDLGSRHTPLRGYLANISPSLYRQYLRGIIPRRMRGADFIRSFGPLPARAGVIDPDRIYRVRTTVDHLISENEHAENFLQAIEELSEHEQGIGPRLSAIDRQRTLRRAGRLMLASHHSYRLRLEQSCPQADWLVDRLMQHGPQSGVYGARISGWGRGGTVVVLLKRGSAADDIVLSMLAPYAQMAKTTLHLLEAGTPGSGGILEEG
jgi:L-arabinokinase